MRMKKVLDILTRRRVWLILLVISGVCVLMVFTGSAALVARIIVIAVQPRWGQQALNRI